MIDGYTKMMPVGIEVEAQMLESVAGYDMVQQDRELRFAISHLNLRDADSIRWLVALLARELGELGA